MRVWQITGYFNGHPSLVKTLATKKKALSFIINHATRWMNAQPGARHFDVANIGEGYIVTLKVGDVVDVDYEVRSIYVSR
jgi:hypothetical protein